MSSGWHSDWGRIGVAYARRSWRRSDDLTAQRGADTREATISWTPVEGAVGYNVRWGLAADRLHATYQRFADQPTSITLRSLNKGVRYVVAVEAFNEHGVSPLSQTVVIAP